MGTFKEWPNGPYTYTVSGGNCWVFLNLAVFSLIALTKISVHAKLLTYKYSKHD